MKNLIVKFFINSINDEEIKEYLADELNMAIECKTFIHIKDIVSHLKSDETIFCIKEYSYDTMLANRVIDYINNL